LNAAGWICVCIYIDSHTRKLDPSNSRYWLQAQCRKFDSDKEKVDVTKVTGAQRKVTNISNIF